MLPLRYATRWRLAGIALLFAVFLCALLPAIWFRASGALRMLLEFDKVAHGAAFALLAVWFSGQYAPRAWWRIALGLSAFGMLIELCQRMTTYRSAEWFDLYADIAGIVIGLLLAWAGAGGWSLRFEQWIAARQRVG
ncbi:MAG: VanZ family protein [Woeseia sp.]